MSTQENNLKAIADAIREKDGTTEPIPANTFPERIRAIETGGLPENVRTITLTADPPEGGTVSGGGVAQDGMTVTVSAQPNDGYKSNGWQENGQTVSEDAEYTFAVSEDRELVSVFAVAPKLPEGYSEVQYIYAKSRNSLNLNTGVYPNLSTGRYLVEFDPINSASKNTIFLSSNTSNGISFTFNFSKTDFGYQYGSMTYTKTVNHTFDGTGRTIIDWNFLAGILSVNSTKVDTAPVSQENKSEIHLYGNGQEFKLYSFKIFDNETIVRDFIPCKNPSGAIGFYDLVERKMYTLTGSYIEAGPAV